jgi:hypothetical protein
VRSGGVGVGHSPCPRRYKQRRELEQPATYGARRARSSIAHTGGGADRGAASVGAAIHRNTHHQHAKRTRPSSRHIPRAPAEQEEAPSPSCGRAMSGLLSRRLGTILVLVLAAVAVLEAAERTTKAHNYEDALQKSLLYFEAQRSGRLPYSQRVTWRHHSGLTDGLEQGVRANTLHMQWPKARWRSSSISRS